MILTARAPGSVADVRRLRFAERYVEAEALAAGVRTHAMTPDEARLLSAEEARLAYYAGRFAHGVTQARELIGTRDIASARGCIAASVNYLALNRGHDALRYATDALLLLRILGIHGDDMVDAQIQLAHVQAHLGHHSEAVRTARASLASARKARSELGEARAHYALGFALWFAGSTSAVDSLLEAERLARPRAGSAWHWILFCIAACLRDLGHLDPALAYATRSQVALRYERAWFHIRAGRPSEAKIWVRPPVSADERPFLRTVLAAINLAKRSRSRPGRLLRLAHRAADEFGRGGLEHWRWGALWIAAADPGARREDRLDLVYRLSEELDQRDTSRWGFYYPPAVEIWSKELAKCRWFLRFRGRVQGDRQNWSTPAAVLLPTLHLLNPEAIWVLREAELSIAEIRTITAALDGWLEGGSAGRASLARRLGLSESSVRARMNSIRGKLNVRGVRGVEPLLAWLAERDLLAPSTQRRVIERLARHSSQP